MNNITCPSCGKTVEITQALKHQIEDQVLNEERSRYKKELENIKKELEEEAAKKAKEELEFKIKDAENEREELKNKNKELQTQLLEMTKAIRELRDQNEKKELENEKRLNQEIKKIKEDLAKSIQEKSDLEVLELKKQLEDTKKSLLDAQRKAEQTSQQLQGEVLELNLEEQLKNAFVFDEFLPIPKGIEGADIWQKVRNKHGQEAGSILWEIKRTKAWSKGWLPKLREDARRINASMCMLVSEVLPEEIKYYERLDGVWVCSYSHAIVLAKVLRDSLLQIAIAKSSASHKDETLQEIYDYIISEAFRHKIEAHFESVKCLREDLEIEKRAMERIWKKRDVQIQRLDRSMSQMFGEIQGIAGAALPSVKGSELLVDANEETA